MRKREASATTVQRRERNMKIRNGDKEKMTKARGAADSIGKAGRGAFFPFTSVFSVLRSVLSVVPVRARPLTHAHIRTYTHTRAHIIHPCSLSFLSSPSSPSTSCSILLRPLRYSPYLPLYVVLPSSFSLSLLYESVCMCELRLSIVVRGFMSYGTTLPRREGGFVRG